MDQSDDLRTRENGYIGVYPTVTAAVRACIAAVDELCDRCQARPGCLGVACYLGCSHWQCRDCATRTALEAGEALARDAPDLSGG